MDCFVAVAPLCKRLAFVTGNDAELAWLLFESSRVAVADYPAATFCAGATFTASLP